ncbi:M30 family zinc metallopeptidase [Cupriavidus campinensis]|uniref:M30 family zinc metallopeptidase n=1 Tax=Cupriavidus campinensis TaxID=151783 RepID=UPI0021CCFACA|nr:hemagglutinin [Cupriavidus campinensis]
MMKKLVLACCIVGGLAGCGGDGGSDHPAAPPIPPTPPAPASPQPSADLLSVACTDCGTVDANTYAGTNVGVWRHVNASATPVDVPINIRGLSGQDVTLVFTNQGAEPQAMPALPLVPKASASAIGKAWRLDGQEGALMRRIGEFNAHGWARLAATRPLAALDAREARIAPRQATLNETRTWHDAQDQPHTATLVRQSQASDGTAVHFWIENAEHSLAKVSDATIDALAASFLGPGKVYDLLTQVGGPLWGAHGYADLNPGTGQPLDIVILKLTSDNPSARLMGYFYARDVIRRSAGFPHSNEAVGFFLNSESLYVADDAAVRQVASTMAHEGMHLQNFYRRGAGHGPQYLFDTWLDEATAMMMEDFVGHAIDPAMNEIRDIRFRDYIGIRNGMYNCSLTTWEPFGDTCESYSVSGSLGGFLNRQLGAGFFSRLLRDVSSENSLAVLDSAIRAESTGAGLGEQLRRFSATAGSLMRAADSPAGYGFPARIDGALRLPLIDPQNLAGIRALTQTVPTQLQPYASIPIARPALHGIYSERVSVPPGTALSVVIQ